MSRIIALDYGSKRTGIAVTDPLQIVPNGLETLQTKDLMTFLEKYFETEQVSMLVIGYPTHLDGNDTYLTNEIDVFLNNFAQKFPQIKIFRQAEWFTSRQASQVILQSGIGRQKRQDKSLIDKVSAVIILEEFLHSKAYQDSRI
ncbi:MAG TPA: Holliday junction resolvase RuvX [Saprospiraceae bacterium]|nr:Holliday junction resolvase RuvX [Saprospiraceae bacterium]HMV23546.1 Holliday junction resolvase RuvX [Saprospiraceae bacterium]HMW75973.1 Holliday junction resolvase RuvX [Saprospiraceae bacterium]HMX82174.1 Holliday junction resolvase RuvX [Saprospiraceae bacterium]HMZ73382.1 Holliday junction resolvase RuvX [Saprospiraceae bacterium]